jgi:Spy/CpxP family protein refolding chaperone
MLGIGPVTFREENAMKKVTWMLLALGTGVLLLGGLVFAEDDNYGPGWGRRGPGMMWGGDAGPGMMGRGWGGGGYGPGMMGGGGMMGMGGPGFSQLPADKQEQLRKLYVSEGQSMVALMADMYAKGQALHDAMEKFPLDESAARKAHEAMDKLRGQMFSQQLSTLAQAQRIVGKEVWEKLQSDGYGPGYGRGRGPGMMGPGGRGPNQ